MPDPTSPPAEAHQPQSDIWQVSLFRLLICVAIFGVLLAAFYVAPPIVAAPLLFFIICGLPAVLTAYVVYARGFERAFCLGALFPAGFQLTVTAWMLGIVFYDNFDSSNDLADLAGWVDLCADFMIVQRPISIACWISACLVGLLTAGVRRSHSKKAL